ncbi:MAG: outer membrane protein transport protein [Smithellaceae bacterium]|jgi:long-subunit fatty acid transport protein|nr:outer membrane protein transport protein [Smithellaceae bacterium]MDD3259939.1 outer membrane protein transport protein [Smithellaceae bacterium]MDD3848757.1 outer membrane protein transport protein [Smithellaceae bacterium]
MKRKHCGYIILLLLLLLVPRDGAAALFEQLAIETRAGSLGNAVTADPQGPLSAHYNPAGLDRVRGTEFTMGIFYIPTLNVQGKFTQGTDPQTGKLWAPFGGWFNNGIDPAAGHGSSTTPSAELPHLGALPMLAAPNLGIGYHSKNSPFAFGFAVYAPFGAGMEHTEADDPYRFLGKRMSVLRLTMAPTISYRVSKSLSVGASFGLGMAYMGFDTRMRAPNDMVALTGVLGDVTTGLEIPIFSELLLPPPWFGGGLNPYEEMGGLKFFAEDNLNTSFNIGWLWEPVSWFSFGGVYQSETKADMQGKYTFDFTKRMQNTINWLGSSPTTIIAAAVLDLPTYCPPEVRGNMSIEVVLPARAQFGIKLQPHRRIKFLADAHWAQWSAWESMKIVLDRDNELLRLGKLMGYTGGPRTLIMENHFKDTWHFSYGLELQPLDMLTLRLGYEDRPTSVSESYFGPLPLGDMKLYSAGLGLALKPPDRKFKGLFGLLKQMLHPDKVDLGFTYMTSDYKVKFNQSKLFNSTNFTDIIYNPFAGLEYEQKITAYIVSLNMTFLF